MSRSWADGSTRQWRRMRRMVLERDGYRCQVPVKGGTASNGGELCGAYATHVDHIVPRSKGGAMLDPKNLRAACQRCNLSRGNGGVKLHKGQPRTGWSW